jgi:phosphate:Na+ symporter
MESNHELLIFAMRLLGSLALLMFGMKLMSETLQKMAGPQLRHVLGRMTTNRFTGMLTGIGVTAAVQSSTATTVMTVSFVSAGLLTLAQAISIIMGANIGTTLTAWIIWAGSTFNITDFVWPAFLVALILIYRQKGKNAGDFIFGLSFLLLGLGTLRQTGADMHLDQNEAVVNFFSSFDPESFRTTILFLLIGGILTMCVQSSAAVMAITMLLCSSGALPIYQGIALVMGENIGTTVTSNIVAYSAGTQARRAAFAHMFFNLFGVFWVLLIFRPFVNMVCWIAGDNLSMVLATFHTCFNVINTGILIWFIPQIERLVCRVIKSKPQNGEDDEEPTRLRYINGGLMETPEISLLQAQKEIGLFGKRTQRMFGMVRELLHMKPGEDFVKLFSRIEKYEGISDNMEFEIGHYLEQVSDAHLSDESKMKIRRMLREISELESIGDACYNMARTLNRKQEGIEDFTPAQYDHLEQLMQLCDDSLTQMNITMTGPREEFSLNRTQDIELAINALRAELKSRNLDDVNAHQYSYTIGTTYTDLLNECEKLGDYVVNVVEARLG